MRVCYALLAATAILQVASAVEDSNPGQLAADNADPSSSKRHLVGISQFIPRHKTIAIDKLLDTKKLDEILDPKRADEILATKKLGGWLDKDMLDSVVSGNFPKMKTVFEGWHADGRTSKMVTRLVKSDPAIEKKYRFAYKMYAEYLKKVYRQENQAKRLAGN